MLRVGFVDGDDRVTQHAALRHGTKPHDACGRLFGTADDLAQLVLARLVQHRHQIGAVVHGHDRQVIEDCFDMAVIGVVVLAADGVRADHVLPSEGGGDGIVGGQRVRSAKHHIGATRFQGEHEVGSLTGHVETRCQLQSL